MKPMSAAAQELHNSTVVVVRDALLMLDCLPEQQRESEDIRVARARLQNYVAENEGRWVAGA